MAIVHELLREYHPRDFAVELWDETRLDPEPGQFCRFTWRINHPGALRAAFTSAKQVALDVWKGTLSKVSISSAS